ncbi:MAG: tRNA preQ1(34) S-adenosylmethionine ribosyltransferase-isomerase QueA [Actinobacteria bacterium]|nr:tRNA preQ1(34) S-adenosylmethionine ribosyltransferase-isomerase QueA [Actinomycetota bacterium]
MLLEELDFPFPEELIAQSPVEPRDSCRLMHLAANGSLKHRRFFELPELLQPGDALVFNDSRVLPARVEARKPTGGKTELLFLRPRDGFWEALARPSHRLREARVLFLPGGEPITLHSLLGDGVWLVAGPEGIPLVSLMERYGRLPLPPYIKRYPGDPESYQTVYAAPMGSAAAPTAGLHFTPGLLETLRDRGVHLVNVTLHVGLDTFQPIREAVVEKHRIHSETYSVSGDSLGMIREARAKGGRIVAVGTTATRVLETVAGSIHGCSEGPEESNRGDVCGETQIFITPGYTFRAVDALLTNFHLPRSSVLALTMAFAGVNRLRAAYQEALTVPYRFFSFGDAMLVEKS